MTTEKIKDAGIGLLILAVFVLQGLVFLWLIDVCGTVLQSFLKDQFSWRVSRSVAWLLVPVFLGAVGLLSQAVGTGIRRAPQFLGRMTGRVLRSRRHARMLRES